MYTDTDNIIYRVEDVYETKKYDIVRFDTSDYLMDNAYVSREQKSTWADERRETTVR